LAGGEPNPLRSPRRTACAIVSPNHLLRLFFAHATIYAKVAVGEAFIRIRLAIDVRLPAVSPPIGRGLRIFVPHPLSRSAQFPFEGPHAG
jgi:hypothetical protein